MAFMKYTCVIHDGDPERIQGASHLDHISADDLLFANYALAWLAENVGESDDGDIRMGFGCAQEIVAALLMERMECVHAPEQEAQS